MMFNFGPNISPGSAAHADLSNILETGGYGTAQWPHPGDVRLVVDVGANVGAFTRWASRTYPKATIIAIEPSPAAFALLRKNIQGRDNVVAINAAASDVAGNRPLYRGSCTLGESSFENIGQQQPAFDQVSTFRLDHLLQAGPNILKVDTEGHELAVLAGATGWAFWAEHVAMEIHRREDEPLIQDCMVGHGLQPVGRFLEGGCEDRIVARFAR